MKKLLGALAVLGIVAPAAVAATGSLKVSPKSVNTGPSNPVQVTVSGSVSGCKTVTIYSNAFNTKHKYTGIPSVNTSVSKGKFKVKIPVRSKQRQTRKTYIVAGRCGSSKFATAKLIVNYQFYP